MSLNKQVLAIVVALLIGFGIASFHVLIMNNGISLYLDSRPLPENIIEYNTGEGSTSIPFWSNSVSYGKYALIDREFPFENLEIGDVIERQFKDKFPPQVVNQGRITEILEKDPLSFKTERLGTRHYSLEGVDYPITEKEYLGKIVDVFKNKDSALEYVDELRK